MNRIIKEEDNVIYVNFENQINLIYYDFQNKQKIDVGPFASFAENPKPQKSGKFSKSKIIFWSSALMLLAVLFLLTLNLVVVLEHP